MEAWHRGGLSMQYRDERLYLVTTDGSLVCVDASEAAITAAQKGGRTRVRVVSEGYESSWNV